MKPPPMPLADVPTQALWRMIPPHRLINDPSIRAEVAARLASVVERAPSMVPNPSPELEAFAAGEIRALVGAVTSLPEQPGRWQQPRYDLRMSLVLWAMVHDASPGRWFSGREHPVARLFMAAGLAAWARDLPPPSRDVLQTPRHKRSAAQKSEVQEWQKRRRSYQRLALSWLRDGLTDTWITALEDRATRQQPTAEESPTARPTVSISGPSKIVMAIPIDVNSSGSRERREEAVRWNRLAAPLPLIAGPSRQEIITALHAEFPWMTAAIDRIDAELGLLEQAAGHRWFHIKPLLLVGPPAAGKSRFARRLGEIVGLHTRVMSVGGSSDSREMAGTARGWGNATPSAPVRLMVEGEQANALVVIDEIDKVASSTHHGRVTDVLLTMLEPETGARWYDEGMGRTVDLSSLNWVLLANEVAPIPAALRSRLGIVRVDRPSAAHAQIIVDGMLKDIAAELGLEVDRLPPLHPDARSYLVRVLGKGASLRQIRAALEKALAVAIRVPTEGQS